jgi:GTP cyclohydrolase II
LVPIDQRGRPFTSLIALVGDARGSHGSLVYMHRGCFFGDALGHLDCRRARAFDRALQLIRAEGRGVVIYHRDDSAPFTGCCVENTQRTQQGADSAAALGELRGALENLNLRAVRLMSSSVDPLPIDTLGLDVNLMSVFELD